MKLAVGYLRRSTDDNQAESLDDQRAKIIAYSDREGYEIIRWYIDDGISGHNVDRGDFVKMIDDAESKNDFQFIIVWRQDRFARFRPAKTLGYLDRLDEAGVQLVSTMKGLIDVNDTAGWIMSGIDSQKDHEYSKSLSEATIGGQATSAKKGRSAGQQAPYGLDRMLVDEYGVHVLRLKKGQRAPSGAGGVIFVPSEDRKLIEVVRRIFREYVEERRGMKTIASRLTAANIPTAKGGRWHQGTIRAILRNEKYCGDLAWNKTRQGKFFSMTDGKAEERSRVDKAKRTDEKGRRGNSVLQNDKADWIVTDSAHDGIIPRSLWKRAQVLMSERSNSSSSRQRATDGYLYLLRGLLYCVHCGEKLHGTKTTRKKDGKEYGYRKYVCSGYTCKGICQHNSVSADELHQGAAINLIQLLGDCGSVRRMLKFALGRKQEVTEREMQIKQLEAEVREIQTKVDRASKRVATAPDDVLEEIYEQIRQFKREKEKTLDTIESSKKELAAQSSDDGLTTTDVIDAIVNLREGLQGPPSPELMDLLNDLIERIDLTFESRKIKGKMQQVMKNARIWLKQTKLGVSVAGTGFEPATSRL